MSRKAGMGSIQNVRNNLNGTSENRRPNPNMQINSRVGKYSIGNDRTNNPNINPQYNLGKHLSNSFYMKQLEYRQNQMIRGIKSMNAQNDTNYDRDHLTRNPAVVAGSSGQAANAAGAQTTSSTYSKLATDSKKTVDSALSGYINTKNLQAQGKITTDWFKNRSGMGSEATNMHTGLHADMKFAAETQTQKERENIQDWSRALGGPVGGIVGFAASKLHRSSMEHAMDYRTAVTNTGKRVDPSTPAKSVQFVPAKDPAPKKEANSIQMSTKAQVHSAPKGPPTIPGGQTFHEPGIED